MKTSPWRVCILVLLALIALGVGVHAAPEPPDPLVGDWLYARDHPVKFKADGTADWQGGGHATWEYLHNPEVQRHYRIVWGHGKSIDMLVLSEDGQSGHVNNLTGQKTQYNVRRAIADKPTPATGAATPAVAVVAGPPDPNDPAIGDWKWGTHGPAKFNADGTVTSPDRRGVWQYLHNPGGMREYVVTWSDGNFIDKLTYTTGAPSGHVVGKRGAKYEATRSRPGDPVTPAATANPFGTSAQ